MKTPNTQSLTHFPFLAALACVLAATTLTVSANDSASRGQLSSHDYKFACEALQGGTMEVTLGQLAQQMAVDESVRQFGQRMIADHQKVNQELTQLLTQKGAALPDTMTKKSDKMTEKLQDEKGTDFDKAYMKRMVKDHKNDVEDFQKASEKSDDADLKSWASKTLPTLQEHLSVAKVVEETVTSKK